MSIQFEALSSETVEQLAYVYRGWVDHVSYYFPLDVSSLTHTLFVQPEVHPATFEMDAEASAIALQESEPVAWIQAGYLSNIPTIPDGQRDGLIRGLMITEGRKEVGRRLLEHALATLADKSVRAWRAFEHNCGYTFATGIGKAPNRMTDVIELLSEQGFKPEDVNLVYAADSLKLLSKARDPASIAVEFLPGGWTEPQANVHWDQFNFSEHGQKVGYATVVPVRQLTNNPKEQTLFVKGIAVEPLHHRRGIGHLIMSTLWDHYHRLGINQIILNTGDDNIRAQKFYEAIGFQMTDLITSFHHVT